MQIKIDFLEKNVMTIWRQWEHQIPAQLLISLALLSVLSLFPSALNFFLCFLSHRIDSDGHDLLSKLLQVKNINNYNYLLFTDHVHHNDFVSTCP